MSKIKSGLPIRPLSDKVILREIIEKDKKTVSGIIIPSSAGDNKDTKKGEVVAVGTGKIVDDKLQKPEVKVGERVLYSWGDEVIIDGTKYIIVASDNISAILN